MPPKKKETLIREPLIDTDPWKLAANNIQDKLEVLVNDKSLKLDINKKDEKGISPLVIRWLRPSDRVSLMHTHMLLSCSCGVSSTGTKIWQNISFQWAQTLR